MRGGMTTVFASIVGDLLHIGHVKFLNTAKGLGDYLIVGVLSDKVVESYKRKPIIPEDERLFLVRNLGMVDSVFLQTSLEPDHKFLDEVDIIVQGDDWKDDFPGAEYMRSIGKEAVNVPYYPDQSTTKIIEKIRRSNEPDRFP